MGGGRPATSPVSAHGGVPSDLPCGSPLQMSGWRACACSRANNELPSPEHRPGVGADSDEQGLGAWWPTNFGEYLCFTLPMTAFWHYLVVLPLKLHLEGAMLAAPAGLTTPLAVRAVERGARRAPDAWAGASS
jgi:hypothetical protein